MIEERKVHTMSTDDEENIGPRLSESTFWFDPFAIPQYELLVKEGHISQELADQYQQQRLEMGLPMTFEEMEARPAPEFEWLRTAGGPAVAGHNDVVILDGEHWTGQCYSGMGKLTYHPPMENGGYLSYEISKPYSDKEGVVRWEASFKVSDGIYARSLGFAATFGDALAAVRQQVFTPEVMADLKWFPCGRDGKTSWVAAGPDGEEIELRKLDLDPDRQWFWEYGLAENSTLRRLACLFDGTALKGWAGTRELAITQALAAHDQARMLAGELVGGDSFAAGVAAGRADLKAAIAKL